MLDITKCNPIPSSAPTLDKIKKSKSKKIVKIKEMYFFISETKDKTIIYSVELGVQLLWTYPRSHAMNMLMKRINLVKDLVDDGIKKGHIRY